MTCPSTRRSLWAGLIASLMLGWVPASQAAPTLIWLLRDRQLLDLTLDTSLQTPLMVAFFTTVGLGGSLGLLRKGEGDQGPLVFART